MAITFDPKKRALTLQERGIDFAVDAEKVFVGHVATTVDHRFDYDEVRNSTVGWLDGRMVMVIWTARGMDRHVISMRRCNARERKKYSKLFD